MKNRVLSTFVVTLFVATGCGVASDENSQISAQGSEYERPQFLGDCKLNGETIAEFEILLDINPTEIISFNIPHKDETWTVTLKTDSLTGRFPIREVELKALWIDDGVVLGERKAVRENVFEGRPQSFELRFVDGHGAPAVLTCQGEAYE